MYTYKPKGVCSTSISFNITNNIISDIVFEGGCDGNLKGLSSLANGMSCADVITRLEGIRCGKRRTSCPDQLVQAIRHFQTPDF